jgi:hypothetical protein
MASVDRPALMRGVNSDPKGSERVVVGETALLEWARSVLSTAFPQPAGWIPAGLTVEPGTLRPFRVGKRPLVGVRVRTDGAAHDVVLKAYRDDRGADTLRLLSQVSEAGLVRPSRNAVTRGLGWSGHHRALVAERAPGVPWRALLHAPTPWLTAGSAAVGRWLAALQSSHVALPGRVEFRDMADMAGQAEALEAILPEQAGRLAGLASAAAKVDAAPAMLVPSHGDLHPNNIHMLWPSRSSRATPGSPVVTALDLDTVGMRRPAYDAGYALAQLLVMSWIRRESLVPGATAGRAFWRRWSRSTPAADDLDAVPAQFARALVQSLHYELAVLRNGRADLALAWCALAETALSDGVEDMLDRLVATPSVVEDLLVRGNRRHRGGQRSIVAGLS